MRSNVSNLLDESQVNSGTTGQPVAPVDRLYIHGLIPPRTITARLSFDF